jgi:uncharacterized tellurite resistance protein B-like protein/predicted lipid-binding transport protein (Tim44 family)
MRPRLGGIAFALATACVGAAANALARPGGGGSYHGGTSGGGGGIGGGGFGGGGFGGGGYHGVGSSTGSAGANLVVLVILLAAVLFIFIARQRRSAIDSGARDALLSAQAGETAAVRLSVSLDALRARDPALTEQSIVDHVLQMADALRGAWCGGDMRPARAFVSDGVFSRFQVQLELMRQENRRNVMGDARVLNVAIEAVENADPFDVVHVRLTAEARDAEVPVIATDQQIRAALTHTPVEPYTEMWSLVRYAGTQSKPAGFQVGRACPSCGAPLDGGESVKCRYCRALVCSGEHDWVLAEITQPVEWHPTSRRASGLDDLHARDPGAAREVLEDRASYLFWKWAQAGRAGAFAPLRKCATPSLLASGAHIEWTRGASDVAVGGADLLACEANDDGFDRAHVKVFWSARFGGSRAYTPIKTVLRMARRSGVASKLSMTALVCPACGAPLSESDTTKCDHCGADLAAGERSWVLDGVMQPEQMTFRRQDGAPAGAAGDGMFTPALPDVADPRERRVLFARMAQLMASDGSIDRRERKLLEMCATRWGIPGEQVQQILASPPRGDYGATLDAQAPERFLAWLVAAAVADGVVDARERALLERACDALKLPRSSIDRQMAAAMIRTPG